MKTFTRATLALLTSSAFAAAAFAETGSSDDSAYETYRNSISSVEALSNTLDKEGIQYNAEVNLEGANTFTKKAEAYNDKYEELQTIFNASHFSN
ncbi:hypothetical protein O1D97_13215 [Marinomonas sp. 15G1-11]|uniref:Soluble cytochrome b562 n=1 Tax=Marinomonas phaeophyticola TaxID=3004091 RepID=A0ABT4JW23_9GAMM|nr:hypothetical protein [Marinomonas sp. 15G1-11]MCZ2722540.1 hypothetical protein [Marinomonas sp. 15G1-11]